MITIDRFIHDNITPKVQCFNDAMAIKKYDMAEGYFHAIADEIQNAEVIFGKAQVGDLNTKQAERKAKLSRIHEVQPLQAVTSVTVDPKVMAEMAPVGINNEGGNDCWADAIFQLIVNAPHIARRILNDPKSKFAPLIRKYYDAQMSAQKVSGVDSQAARKVLLPGSGQEQSDAAEGLSNLLSTTGFGFNIYEELTTPKGEKEGREQFDPEPILPLALTRNYATIQELVDSRFAPEPVTDHKEFNNKTTKLDIAPDDLVIQVNRVQGKKDYSIEQAERFTLSSKSTRFNAHDSTYELTGCVIHNGKTGKSGHYVAVVKKPDGWYLANDSVVTKLKDHEVSEYLKKAYVFHYAKSKESRSCCSDGVISAITKTASQILSYPYNAIRRFIGTSS